MGLQESSVKSPVPTLIGVLQIPVTLSVMKYAGIDILDIKPIDISDIIIEHFANSLVLGPRDPCGVGGKDIPPLSSASPSVCWTNIAILETTDSFQIHVCNL